MPTVSQVVAAAASRSDLPSGTVTFVFTDIEGSTKLAHALGTDRWREVLVQHAAAVRSAALEHEGVEVRTEGDAFFLAFRTARQAVAAAADAQRALAAQTWPHGVTVRVRIGMHTGESARPGDTESGADYVGYDVHQAARISSAAHGGQVIISSATQTLLGDQLPPGVTLLDLGEHRLKDIRRAERLFQLVIEGVPNDFPALRTLERAPNNLPAQLTSFIGRRRELADARTLLERTRLLTLLGPGGTGKSRLSLELAAEVMGEFPDGVWFVRLAPVSDHTLVASTIAHTLGLVVPPARTPLQHLIEELRAKKVLLLIDNFEHVVDAATDVAEVLRECPSVKAIVSTRIVLHVAGEQEYPVPPLALPDPKAVPDVEEIARAEAIQLFLERARAARPEFMLTRDNARAVVGIVAHLDGLPLAIELAAARVKVLPPQAILERLASGIGILQSSARDLPARQQTLRGAIAWSYDLLDAGLRRLLQRLSVFRGGCALEQIELVCGPAGEIDRDVLDGVSELVDQSLLRRVESEDEPRFLMLETIREFARERLEESGEARDVQMRHARAFLRLAEGIAPRLFGSEQKALLDRLELEQGNLRTALDICAQSSCADRLTCTCPPEEHAGESERTEISLRLSGALWRFWQMRGHLAEGRQRTERILAIPGAEAPRDAYLIALEAAGGITYWQGDIAATERSYTRRLEVARATGDPVQVANALYDLSFVHILSDDERDIGAAMLDEALAAFRAAGDRAGVAKALWAVATTHFNRHDWAKAVGILDEVVRIFRDLDNRFGLAWALHSLGVGRIRLGAMGDARTALAEGLELFRAAGDVSGVVLFFYDFAELAAAQGRDDRALRLRSSPTTCARRTSRSTWRPARCWSGATRRGRRRWRPRVPRSRRSRPSRSPSATKRRPRPKRERPPPRPARSRARCSGRPPARTRPSSPCPSRALHRSACRRADRSCIARRAWFDHRGSPRAGPCSTRARPRTASRRSAAPAASPP
ncbi:MAG: adenylate/guanylate cyclase domain-containing protein [Chloroflexi bacterium]|nr:adenylate/guanylate cyclase domain-containing protein [Chloroflexota bacterium]